MPIGALATFTYRVLRRTSILLAPTAAAATLPLTTTECPEGAAYAEFTVEGATALTGTITVAGELDGVPDTEDVPVAGPIGATGKAIVRTCKRWTCFTAITTTGLDDEAPPPTISARLIGVGGESIQAVQELDACVVGNNEGVNSGWKVPTAGSTAVSPGATIDHDNVYDFTPRRGDLYVDLESGEVWEVLGAPPTAHGHHYELRVAPADARPTTVVTP